MHRSDFIGYADTTLEQNTFTLSIEPQHDRAHFQGRLILQDSSTFTGISASFDSNDTPAELQDFNRYSRMKSGERTLYRTYDYVAP